MDILASMRVFSMVVETGSFAAAANRLEMSRAMASKYVMHLEAHLKTRLLHRTTRKLGLTEAGALYLERCTQILADVRTAEEGVASLSAAPRGVLRVTMPVSFGVRHVGPLLAEYLRRHPEVSVDVLVDDRRIDLIEEGVDLAIRIGAAMESGLIARKLAADRLVVCASPAYLERCGIPTKPADLSSHNCMLYTYAAARGEWKLQGPDDEQTVNVAGNLRANNGDLVTQAVVDGVGIMCQPSFLVGDEIRAGRLVEVLKEYVSEPIGIYAVYPSRKHLSAKIRTFVDFLAEKFARRSEW